MGQTDPYINYNVGVQSNIEFSVSETAEVIVEEEDGKFKIYRIIEKMVPQKVKEEMKLKLFDGKDFGEFLTWMTDLNSDELEAARQIYYDIWNFKSGDSDDKARFELIEGEQKKRKSTLSFSGGAVTVSSGGTGGVFLTGKQ